MGSMEWNMADRQIREAMERGEFDNLPGSGKPLNLQGSNNPNWWITRKIESENLEGIAEVGAPGVLALRREASRFPESLLDEHDEEAVRARLEDFNARVKRDRLHPDLTLPIPVVAPMIDIDDMIAAWRRLKNAR
ncbi:DUF1992 domain-containing protein [uncultured Agrococcus sp.]|uniref:DnaJ family domain-containing protein n=1 Tax=uncultured Agrococcus sp. TaxID=382258 RepID=UPI0025F6AE2F|nr:DUF1992 domain-containing protein [uncultured Agrococcus sp.]